MTITIGGQNYYYFEKEMGDSELRTLALQSGSYEFWNDPCEDIYTLEDGEPIGDNHVETKSS